MPSPRPLLLVPAAVAAIALAGCTIGDDGPRITQTRDVAQFTRIDNSGSVDVRLHVGSPQRVQVRAGEKVIDDVRTEVRDGTLHLAFDHDGFGGNNIIVDASVPELTGVEASGRATSTWTASTPARSRCAPTAPPTCRSRARPGGSRSTCPAPATPRWPA